MRELFAEWKKDRLWGSLCISWLAAVAASFWGPYLLPITVPLAGTLYLFRILLPVAAALYVLWAAREKDTLWKNVSALEKWCYALIAAMLLYGAVSLFRAVDFSFTFRRLFNLCFDLCFFFLMLRLCRNKRLLSQTAMVTLVSLIVMMLLGVYEIFRGGIFEDMYDDLLRFLWLNGVYQFPVVAEGNTNNYGSMLLFIYGGLLLFYLKEQPVKRSLLRLMAVLAAAAYFFMLATKGAINTVGFWLIFAGFVLYCLAGGKGRRLAPLLSLALMLAIFLGNHYCDIVPPIQSYWAQVKQYEEQMKNPPSQDGETVQPPKKPSIDLGNSNQEPLADQFFATDEEMGETVLREDGTAGVRARLLVHAFGCFRESRFLGVGLGNTEMLARDRQVTQNGITAIHCFVARLIGDFGLFVLLPLCMIGLLLLKQTGSLLLAGIRRRDGRRIGYALLFFFVLCAYPFVSTAPSDCQDLLSMWQYLGFVVLMYRAMKYDGPCLMSEAEVSA